MRLKETEAAASRAKGDTLRRQWLLHTLRTVIPIGLASLAVLACLIWFLVVQPAQETRDMAGVPLREETLPVAAVVYPRGRDAEVFVHIGDRTGSIRTPIPFQIGQQASVAYRVGKSGRVYIESIHPLARGENLADHASVRH